jgi:hypothetical protein
MPNAAAVTSPGALLACVLVGGPALLLWVYDLALLGSLTGSDPAGNSMTQGFAALAMILLWVLLGVFTLIAAIGGQMPPLSLVAAVLLIPASGIAAGAASELLARPQAPPFLWPMLIPAIVPPLVLGFGLWALLPPLRAALPAGLSSGAVWGIVLAASLAVVPMRQSRQEFNAREAAAAAEVAARLAAVPADAPVWALLPYLKERGTGALDETVLQRIQHLATRQNDIETMLDRGDFPFAKLNLATLDLDPTPALCDKAHGLLDRRAAALAAAPAAASYRSIALEADGAISALEWLVGYGCPSAAQIAAWQAVLARYPDVGWDTYRLEKLHDPQALGRILRLTPARFSMLTPAAHLRAWLSFAGEPATREAALAGARRLDHREADAIEMLGDEFQSTTVLRYLPELDLPASPALCTAALAALDQRIDQIYRPPPGEPRDFAEFLSRLGDVTLPALVWVARQGCAADGALDAVASLALAYQDSPERPSFLAQLSEARRPR